MMGAYGYALLNVKHERMANLKHQIVNEDKVKNEWWVCDVDE